MSAENALSRRQRDDLRAIAAMMIPASAEYDVPGADDAAIQAEILATLGRDTGPVGRALDQFGLHTDIFPRWDEDLRKKVAKPNVTQSK